MEEEKKNQRKAVILMIVGVITLMALVIGATYAYFSAQVGTGDKAQINAKAGTTDDLTFATTGPITITANQTNFAQGEESLSGSATATAHLIAGDDDNTATEHYYLYLQIDANNLTYTLGKEQPELIMEITDPNKQPYTEPIEGLEYKENITDGKGVTYSGYDITEAKGLFAIAKNYEIIASNDKTDTWTIKVTFLNLATDQHENTDKTLTGKLIIQKEKIPENLADACTGEILSDCIKENYKYDKTIIYHNAIAASEDKIENSNKVAGDDSYRFSGADADVKNYVCLDSKTTGNCESDNDLYRIIGLFKNNQDKYEMKLIKAQGATTTELGDSAPTTGGGAYYGLYSSSYSSSKSSYKGSNWETLATYNWNKSNGTTSGNVNMWAESNLNKVNLNQFFYDYITKRATYLENHITEHTWTTGGTSNTSDAKAVYDSELGDGKVKVDDEVCYTQGNTSTKRKCTQEDIEYPAHIGLMYVSDYMYGTTPNNWTTTASNYDSTTVRNNNWLYSGMHEWLISRHSSNGDLARRVGTTGYANSFEYVDFNNYYAVRPSFYLTSDAKIKEGEGSKETPYRLSWN